VLLYTQFKLRKQLQKLNTIENTVQILGYHEINVFYSVLYTGGKTLASEY